MRRLICAVLAAALLAGICLAWTAIAEDEDDSVMIPVDLEEEKTEVQAFRVLQSGDSGDDVIFLQTRLEDLKYYSGEIDGQYSQATEKAVKSFQQDFSMEATGIADLETQMVLYTTMYRPLKYGATGEDVKELQTRLTALGYGNLPICVAKTQYSFSDDPAKLGAPDHFTVTVRNLKVSAGAGFIVALTGDIMTMPGLPKSPAAERIDVDENGKITGLF